MLKWVESDDLEKLKAVIPSCIPERRLVADSAESYSGIRGHFTSAVEVTTDIRFKKS